jgi:murein DD-endopeptidase MepM/ murein hydrolase activator NlpD
MMTALIPRWRVVLVGLCLTLVLPVFGQTIYIWEDEEGVTHFADRKPRAAADHEITIQRAEAEPKDLISVRRTGPQDDPVWLFDNRIYGPVTVRIALAEADNVVTEPRLPADFVLASRQQRELVTIGPLDERRSWRYRFETAALPGRSDARHRPERPYRPPIPPGSRHRIGQAFGGEHSHRSAGSYHAVDIQMPLGTPVHAARGGRVMDVARHFHGAGDNPEYDGPRANFVRILHDDGSMAVYAHLDFEGVTVRPGQRVARGAVIGRSGNTGFSTGPHLHFVVQVNRDMQLVSVPFEFEDENGRAVAPASGQRLTAP